MKDYSLLKVNLMEGIVSTGTFQLIFLAVRGAEVREVKFGARQQFGMCVKETLRGSGTLELKK